MNVEIKFCVAQRADVALNSPRLYTHTHTHTHTYIHTHTQACEEYHGIKLRRIIRKYIIRKGEIETSCLSALEGLRRSTFETVRKTVYKVQC
jgi:hypothetical protein